MQRLHSIRLFVSGGLSMSDMWGLAYLMIVMMIKMKMTMMS